MLFGQPELNQHLHANSIRQLAQRITFHYHLGPLSRDDIEYYLAHRLRVAGYTGGRLFSRGAIGKLFRASGGIPRLVNIMANKSLMLCFGEGRQQVTRRHVNLAARDTNGVVGARAGVRWPWLAAGVSVLVAACGLTWALTK